MTAVLTSDGIDLKDAIDLTNTSDVYAKAKRYADAAKDAVVDTRILHMGEDGNLVARGTPQGDMKLLVSETAHRQLAEKTGIDWKYYQRMRVGQTDLLATNVNRWLTTEPNRHLIRMLKPVTEDEGRAVAEAGAHLRLRAVLSPKFRVLDNAALLNVVLPVAAQHGATVSGVSFTDDRFSLRLIGPRKSLEDIRREHGIVTGANVHVFVNEILSFGLSLTNSETGFAALLAEAFAEIARCLNGYVVSERARAVHIGGNKQDGFLSDETKRLEDAAVFLRVRDKAVEIFGPESQLRTAKAIEAGLDSALKLPEDVPLFQFVDGVGLNFDLTEVERDILKEEVMNEVSAMPSQNRLAGAVSQFTLAQGMTALARRVNSGEAGGNFDRRVELERAGWEVLTSPAEKLVKQAVAHLN
jgi:hypothetical protein